MNRTTTVKMAVALQAVDLASQIVLILGHNPFQHSYSILQLVKLGMRFIGIRISFLLCEPCLMNLLNSIGRANDRYDTNHEKKRIHF